MQREVKGRCHMVSSLEGRRTATGGALGSSEDSHWRGGGQSLEGRRTATGGSHWRGGGQPLEAVTGGAEDSHWRGGGQ